MIFITVKIGISKTMTIRNEYKELILNDFFITGRILELLYVNVKVPIISYKLKVILK